MAKKTLLEEVRSYIADTVEGYLNGCRDCGYEPMTEQEWIEYVEESLRLDQDMIVNGAEFKHLKFFGKEKFRAEVKKYLSEYPDVQEWIIREDHSMTMNSTEMSVDQVTDELKTIEAYFIQQSGGSPVCISEAIRLLGNIKEGEWIILEKYNKKGKKFLNCSVCNYGDKGDIVCEVKTTPNFCPNCGSRNTIRKEEK